MKSIFSVLLITATLSVFFSCQKNVSFTDDSEIPEPVDTLIKPSGPVSEEMVTASVMGKIVDEQEEPMTGATVRVGGKAVVTDEYGIFRLESVSVPKQSAFITVEKTGYLQGSRTISVQQNGSAFVRVKMVKKILRASFDAGTGAAVTISGSASVTFPAAGFRRKSGQVFEGKVFAYGVMYDPSAEDFDDVMPGALRGLTADSQATALKSYGMLNVVLETESGEPLELSKSAQIKLPVTQSLLGGAPAEIPLWHFSEVDGKWREEGRALLRDGAYFGEVSHFSTWNVDAPYAFAFVKFRVVGGAKELPVPYARVTVTDKTSGNYGSAFSDSVGWVTIQVPKNAPLEIEVKNECGVVLGSAEVAAVNNDQQLDAVYIKTDHVAAIAGTVTMCNGMPAESGLVSVFTGGLTYTSQFRDGQFYVLLSECWEGVRRARMAVYDPEYTTASTEKMIDITSTYVDAGNFDLCGSNFTQYAWVNANGDSVKLAAPPDIVYCGFGQDSLWHIGFTDDQNTVHDVTELRMEFPGKQAGERLASYCVLSYINIHPILSLYTVEGRPETQFHVTVTQTGPVGTYIKFTFEGMLYDAWAADWKPVSGEISALRTY